MNVIDLFAGCGGFSIGFTKSGFNITKAIEFDKSIATTYINNHSNTNVIIDDIANVDNSNIFKFRETDVIIGGPPCQGFSMAGARIRNGFIDDPRNYLFKHYFNVVKTVKPKIFIMENVKGMINIKNGYIFNEIIKIFNDKKQLDGDIYNIYYRTIKATDFGIPQSRERVIIIGTLNKYYNFNPIFKNIKNNILKKYPSFFDKVSVWDAISNLSLYDTNGNGEISNIIPETKYQEFLSSDNLKTYNHIATNHSPVAKSRMKKILSGENYLKLNENIKSIHSGSYGRLEKYGIAPTITTRFDTPSAGKFIHPIFDRTITPREAARIQSFPDNYIFYGNKSSICKQIGNAVPPKISYFFAEVVKEIL